MKYLLALLLLSGICFADSTVDYFTYYNGSDFVYTWSLPSSPTGSSPTNGIGFQDVAVTITQSGKQILGPNGESTINFNMNFSDFSADGNASWFSMSCWTGTEIWHWCNVPNHSSFDDLLYAGNSDNPVFVLGSHTITDEPQKLVISDQPVSVPEGSELALVALSGLVMLGGMKYRRQ